MQRQYNTASHEKHRLTCEYNMACSNCDFTSSKQGKLEEEMSFFLYEHTHACHTKRIIQKYVYM